MKNGFRSLVVVLVVAFTSSLALANGLMDSDDFRVWSDSSGEFSVEARLVRFDGKTVFLERKNGKAIRIPIGKLSDTDQAFVKKTIAERRAARAKAKAEKEGTKGGSAKSQAGTDSVGSESTETSASDSWFQWRGPNRDGIAPDEGLLESWETKTPKLLWSASGAGGGMSSVVIADGRIFTLGNRQGKEQMIAFDLKDGKELWAATLGNGGKSNGTPTVDGDLVYAVGIAGDLICAESKTGTIKWQKNFESDFGGRMMSEWGFSESPLIDGDLLICTPGGPQAMIAALDKKTGKTVWKTPMRAGGSRGTDGAGYASIVVSKGGGVKQYITLVGRGLISVSAKNGKPLWHYEKIANGTANVPTPIVDGDYVFCSSGYNDGGSALLKLSGRGGAVRYQEVYYQAARDLQNHHGGMIKIGDHVYLGNGHNQGFPMCINMKTGRKTWEQRRGAGTGSAAVAAADGHLYFRYENGIMALIEVNPKEYKLKGSFRIDTVNGKSWPHPVINDQKLYLRDQDNIHCYDLRKEQ